MLDEYTRECLALVVGRSFRSQDILEVLEELVVKHGRPEHVRSDNGPEFIADAVKGWLKEREIQTLFIAPGSPWENGFIESFFSGLRKDLMDREVFTNLYEAKALLQMHRIKYNEYRPHRALGRITPQAFKKYQDARSLEQANGLS